MTAADSRASCFLSLPVSGGGGTILESMSRVPAETYQEAGFPGDRPGRSEPGVTPVRALNSREK